MDSVDKRRESAQAASVASDPSGTTVITLAGEIDISNIDTVRAVVDPVVDGGREHLVFDLSGVDFMDSSGLAVLLQAAAKIGTVTLRRPSPLLVRILDANGLREVLAVEP